MSKLSLEVSTEGKEGHSHMMEKEAGSFKKHSRQSRKSELYNVLEQTSYGERGEE